MTKRLVSTALILGLSMAPTAVIGTPALASNNSYSSCASLNKKYPSGVALSAKSKNTGAKALKAPKISASIYKLNRSLDKDNDGIACELVGSTSSVDVKPSISLDNLEPKLVRLYGVAEITKALKKSSSAEPKVSITYDVSGSVPSLAVAQVKHQIKETSKLYSKLFNGQSVSVRLHTELEDSSGFNVNNPYTCGGQAWADFRTRLCLPSRGLYGGESFGFAYHEFTHIAQYTQVSKASPFFTEGSATYVAGVLGFANDGIVDYSLNSWLNKSDGWKVKYESLGFKYTVEDMAKFLDLSDGDSNYGNNSPYYSISFKVGSAMWEAMIAVYGWDKFIEFMDSLDNGQSYSQNFKSIYSLELKDAHAKIAKYIISINWG